MLFAPGVTKDLIKVLQYTLFIRELKKTYLILDQIYVEMQIMSASIFCVNLIIQVVITKNVIL